ncbi:MAG: 50S ribosomal protein L21 [Bacilli bacterium]|nr:50S ribosomal protein L21 [Bacilli bacterium]
MKAIIENGGKQYSVEEGKVLFIEKMNVNPGDKVVFDNVLMVDGKIGTPYVKGAKVTAEVVKLGKTKKVLVYKYNAKKQYRKLQGHRQPYTQVEIKKIEVK